MSAKPATKPAPQAAPQAAEGAKPPTIAPVLVLKDENGLTAPQLVQAKILQEKCPAIVQAVTAALKAEKELGDKYFDICRTIRETSVEVVKGAAVRTLNRKEVALLLQSLGYRKQRIAEINRVVEVSDEIWKQYQKRHISFRATLQLARGGEGGEGGEGADGEGAGGDAGTGADAGKPKAKLAKELATELAAFAVKHFEKLKSTKGKIPYAVTYEGPDAEGNEEKRIEFTIKVTQL